ncbi:MAG: histidinol-phosphatase [Bacteroidales bacterium]|jgi:histidinol-phosphatase (PHP family)|nr:histidinol-phosphatase [Bacteroidales bacterium]
MSKKFAFHTHSNFCDGKNSLEEMVLAAIDKGLTHYGFSSHAPVPFENRFAIKQECVGEYLQECNRLKQKYEGKIKLFVAMEFDYITDIMEDINAQAEAYNLDYFIASVHMVKAKGAEKMWFIDGGKQEVYDQQLESVFDGDIRKGVETFFCQTNAMIKDAKPNVVGHLDKIKMHNKERYFKQTDAWYEDLMMTTLQTIKSTYGTICEINTRGLYKGRCDDYFPSRQWIKRMAQMQIPVTISTDCHRVEEIDCLFEPTCDMLRSVGYNEIWYFDKHWQTTKI